MRVSIIFGMQQRNVELDLVAPKATDVHRASSYIPKMIKYKIRRVYDAQSRMNYKILNHLKEHLDKKSAKKNF